MGMFDWLACEYPLPHKHEGESLQSKDTPMQGCCHYTISEDGRLLYHEEETTPKEERPYYGTPKQDDPLYAVCGIIRRSGVVTDTEYHGDIVFYGWDADGVWREYSARFTDGKITRLDEVPAPPTEEEKCAE